MAKVSHDDAQIMPSELQGDSIRNDNTLINPSINTLEFYTIYGTKDQGFTFLSLLFKFVTDLKKAHMLHSTVYIFHPD